MPKPDYTEGITTSAGLFALDQAGCVGPEGDCECLPSDEVEDEVEWVECEVVKVKDYVEDPEV